MPLRVETEECRECGQSVMVMAFKWTGFCSGDCQEEYIAKAKADAEQAPDQPWPALRRIAGLRAETTLFDEAES